MVSLSFEATMRVCECFNNLQCVVGVSEFDKLASVAVMSRCDAGERDVVMATMRPKSESV